MPLRDLHFQEDYRSGCDNILEDFIRPALRESIEYWRAVGYFSSSSLEALGTPLGEFVINGGRIRLVTSVELSEEDIMAIRAGVNKRTICEQRLEEIIEKEFADGVGDGVSRLIRLLELDRLEIKIAVPKHGTGIYHEKIGIFFDNHGDYVAFTGSTNETRKAYEENRECIDVFTSWEAPTRAERKRKHFEEVWNGTDAGVDVYTFPEAAKKKMIRIRSEKGIRKSSVQTPLNKWRHQDEAVEIFITRERGILNMATGTGKTRTTLKIICKLFNSDSIDTVIITTDGTDLLDQWYAQLISIRHEITRRIRFYRDYSVYKDVLDFTLDPEGAVLLVSRAAGQVRDPLVTALKSLTPDQAHRTLLVHDEVHRLGSPNNRMRLSGLSENIRYRLGLSATPEREYDEEGNKFIEQHIGPELFRFDLSDAIRRGILVPFRYYPLSYVPSQEDRHKLRDLYRKRAAREAAGNPMTNEEFWTELAKVYKTSRAKIPVFDQFIRNHQDLLERCIIFVETSEYGMEVLEVVHKYRSDFHTYLSDDDQEILCKFARRELECLITCHRISEGIDIQSLNTVILFSAAKAKLETIQRIGRCLRFDPANPKKIANVIDFIREPEPETEDGIPNTDLERRNWLMELSRIRCEEL